ncbi:Zn(2)-C6 fungal-type domain-containing protein [Favolaschia claudopus]|uniref:Zn(2)-C6 fungal-type domain-containing protein n=1 Tax=Favolaschia claudopus TaxID=2862362 RepID=A0AAW0EGS1_9AGAR
MLSLARPVVKRSFVPLTTSRSLSVLQSLLHGSPEAKQAGELDTLQHSRLVGRGKYIHAVEIHRVRPDKTQEYKEAAEKYFLGIKNDAELRTKLTGNWEVIIGEQDTFIHILEIEGYEKTTQLFESPTRLRAFRELAPFITSRSSQLNQEFAFLPTAPPHAEGGVFELRSYQLKPGTLLEWENTWHRGIEARRKFVAPVGAWFSQVGRLHQVHHLWQYPSLEARKELREKAWQIDGWAETVSKSQATSRKRSSRACDQCRKTKSKCERVGNETCKGCVLAGHAACTFLGPSYKRGPPKGYIHAIESRWHQVEALLGALLQCPDSRVQSIVSDLRTDELARDILGRVDAGPYGPSGRLDQPGGATKEDFFASILRSNASPQSDTSRSRRQSRVSREKVSSIQDRGLAVVPTKEWQDSLSNRLAASFASGSRVSSFDVSGLPLTQRRRLNGSPSEPPAQPDWSEMYTLDGSEEPEELSHHEFVENMGTLSLDEHQEVRFHGHTSGLHLLARSSRTDTRKEDGLWNLPMARVWPPAKDPGEVVIREEDMEIELPAVHVQEHLIQLYFTYVHPVFPALHKTRFLTEYNTRNISSPRSPDSQGSSSSMKPESAQKYSPLLLLAVFALSARFSDRDTPLPPKGEMWEAGGKYLDLAKLILAKVLHRSRPTTCQTLLLLGYREFGIGSMEQGWIYIGMAIRMAIDLGLNCNLGNWKTSNSDQTLFTREETQTRRQIWWACLLADRYGSMYMGRPITIRDEDFDTPLPEDEEEQPWEALSSGATAAPNYPGVAMSVFRYTGRLAIILGNVITKLYPVRPSSVAYRQAWLAKLETKLDQWFLSLPEVLRYDTASRRIAPSPPVLQLHIRYWGTVLLLHRAFIPNWKNIDPTPKDSTLELKAFDLAQGAASHISAIATAYRESFGLKRCSPFLTSYLLNAGIMHISTLALRPSNPQASLGFQQCLTALKEMEITWPSAARAFELLNGVKLGALHAPVISTQSGDRHKRHAEDAFGQDRSSEYPLRDGAQFGQNVDGVQDVANKLMAHMLGLDIPGVEPSTSFYAGCDWWSRPNEDQQALPVPLPTWQQSVPSSNGLPFPALNVPRGWSDSKDGGLPYSDAYRYDHFGV